MKGVRTILLPALALALFVGCKAFDGYVRTYTISAEDRFGQKVSIGLSLSPRQAEMVPQVIDQLEQGGVIAKGANVEEDAPLVLEPAAEQLAILTTPAENSAPLTVPPSPSDTMFWLTRNGDLRVVTSPEALAMYRGAGWVDAPMPLHDPERHGHPQWRNGKWVFPMMKGGRRG